MRRRCIEARLCGRSSGMKHTPRFISSSICAVREEECTIPSEGRVIRSQSPGSSRGKACHPDPFTSLASQTRWWIDAYLTPATVMLTGREQMASRLSSCPIIPSYVSSTRPPPYPTSRRLARLPTAACVLLSVSSETTLKLLVKAA